MSLKEAQQVIERLISQTYLDPYPISLNGLDSTQKEIDSPELKSRLLINQREIILTTYSSSKMIGNLVAFCIERADEVNLYFDILRPFGNDSFSGILLNSKGDEKIRMPWRPIWYYPKNRLESVIERILPKFSPNNEFKSLPQSLSQKWIQQSIYLPFDGAILDSRTGQLKSASPDLVCYTWNFFLEKNYTYLPSDITVGIVSGLEFSRARINQSKILAI